jgi:hypothetical protein
MTQRSGCLYSGSSRFELPICGRCCPVAIVGSPNLADAPHLPPWALLGSAVLMEIPIAMIVACRLLPFRANRLANIVSGAGRRGAVSRTTTKFEALPGRGTRAEVSGKTVAVGGPRLLAD